MLGCWVTGTCCRSIAGIWGWNFEGWVGGMWRVRLAEAWDQFRRILGSKSAGVTGFRARARVLALSSICLN